jgi:hypothetical protein
MVTVADLFKETPHQWGLRGDVHLWREMTDHFALVPLPANAAELDSLIETAFTLLTKQPITTDNPIYIKRLDHGGMSGGHVSPAFWRDKVKPLMKARFAQIK